MFIREQVNPREMRFAPADSDLSDLVVWSAVSTRHCMWLFAPLCRSDERGRIIKGSRRRNPFPPYRAAAAARVRAV